MNNITEEMKNIFEYAHPSLVQYWKSHGLSEHDFKCRKCGTLIPDIDEIGNVEYHDVKDVNRQFLNTVNGRPYRESETSRWSVKGRTLSGKTYFRHLCWDCFFKQLVDAVKTTEETHIVDAKVEKYWIRLLNSGRISSKLKIPVTWNSPVWWFKLLFDISEEELQAERKKFDTASLESFVRRYGETDGRQKFQEYCKMQARNGCALDYFVEKYGEVKGRKEYERVCRDKGVSKKNCLRKYGKKAGTEFWNQYCRKQAYAGTALEYFIDKYGVQAGKEKYLEVCRRKALTL